MIRTFRNKPLRQFFETGNTGKLPVQNDARVRRALRALMVATKPEDMNLPGYYFHGLEGGLRWSVPHHRQLATDFRLGWRGRG